MRRFTFLKGQIAQVSGPIDDVKNASLPKTASTINNKTQTTLEIESNRKQISK